MKPDPQQPADLLNLLRQQVLLAQARIMELEDERDTLAPRLAETEKLLAGAQSLAEREADAVRHAGETRASLQAEFDHLRHVQHITNEALNAARAEVAGLTNGRSLLLAEIEQLQLLTAQLAAAERGHLARIAEQQATGERLRAESAERQARITQLDAEQRALKSSRSWRWTAWLRALERRSK
jgi:chromosome segregation ATPase